MIKLLYIDLFCGAGGTSTGVEDARTECGSQAKVIACVNHDKNAIASHAANHPEAIHFTEDIRTLVLHPLVDHVNMYKELYPDAYVVLWASLECTNFSKAKGGLPRDADSRTLAEHLFRYIDVLSPDYIQIENVEEFMCWGDLDESGKPISKDHGRLYRQWVGHVKAYGYGFDYKILNAADFGAYTSRKRFFGQFSKSGLPIIWPEPTHSKNGESSLFGKLEKWKPVKDVLDFNDEGTSIFTRKKPLSEKTLERIYAGLIKFVAGGKDKWLLKYNSVNQKTKKHNPPSIDDPCPVIGCQDRLGIVQTKFIQQRNGGNPQSKVVSVDNPARTITATGGNQEIVSTHFLSKYFSGHPQSKNISVNEPAHTIRCKDNHSLVATHFLSAYYGSGDNVSSINRPCPVVRTKDTFNYVNPQFIDQQYGQSKPAGIRQPLGSLTATPKYNLVSCRHWIMNTNFNNVGFSIDEPSQTITANRKWHYLVNPQYNSKGGDINKPCFTLIARMDKTPPYLVCTHNGNIAIEIYKEDSPMTKNIKEFMAMYGIIDILMRMLKIPELKRIMGFPDNYTLIGTQTEQKKHIGNAVEVTIARKMCEALLYALSKSQLKVS